MGEGGDERGRVSNKRCSLTTFISFPFSYCLSSSCQRSTPKRKEFAFHYENTPIQIY